MSSVGKTSTRPSLYTGAERRRLDPELLVASRARGYLQCLLNIAVFVGVLVLASRATPGWWFVPLYLGVGLAQHRLFFPLHDCIHYSLFPTKTENRIFGMVLSALLGTSFEAIRDQHMDHHRDFGTPEDPGASDYFPRFQSRTAFLGFVLGPLVGSILFAKVGDYLLRPSRAAAQPDAQSAPRKTTSIGAKALGYAVILVVQGVVAAILTNGFQMASLYRYPLFNVLPAVTIFLFCVRLRMFLEHGSLNYEVCDYSQGKRPTARSIYASWFERVFICGSDFNYHHEHHLYPVVPGRLLPKLHHQLLGSGLDREDVRETYAQAFAEIWQNLAKAPLSGEPKPRSSGSGAHAEERAEETVATP